ncbi:hypothetical protein N7501_003156 [Penicillium viridicatum]|nr:hypothetical protein N7501_003156 [Penicillium viridicatum]
MSSTFERSGIFVSCYGLAANYHEPFPLRREGPFDVKETLKEDAAATGVPADENSLPDDFNNKFLYYINISLEGFAEPPNYSFHNIPRSPDMASVTT